MISTLREAVRLALVAAVVFASIAGRSPGAVLQGQAARRAGQLRARAARPTSRGGCSPAISPGISTASPSGGAEHGRRRRFQRRPTTSARSRRATAPCSASSGGTAWQYANDPSRFRADVRTYEFIAFQPGTTVYYVRKDVAPGMKERGRHRQSAGAHRRRQRRAQRPRSADPAQPRHPRCAAPLRHRLSQRPDRAARACNATKSISTPSRRRPIAARSRRR